MDKLTTIDEAIQEISMSWRKTTQAIIETAKVLKKYQLESNWSEIQEKLDSENIIKISVQKFLLSIGNNPVLTNEQNYQKLPPHYNTLYHLSTIKSDKLIKFINDESVNASIPLSEAKKLAEKYNEKKKNKTFLPKYPKIVFTITLSSTRGMKSKSDRIYDSLVEEFGEDAVDMKTYE